MTDEGKLNEITLTYDGDWTVMVDGVVLDPAVSTAVMNHSPDGFAWGYRGSGPAQTALAILLATGVEPDLAVKLHQQFKDDFVSGWPMRRGIVTNIPVGHWVESERVRRILDRLTSWPSIEEFYKGVELRVRSLENDFGLHWVSGKLWATHYRITAIHDTGEFYAIRLGRGMRDEPAGVVYLVGRFRAGDYAHAEELLEGWADGARTSLGWALDRLVPTLDEAQRRMIDPEYVPTLAEALVDPAGFVEGMTEVES